jgi:phage minor structural protein
LASKFVSRLELHVGSIRHILASAFEVRVHEAVNGEFYTQFIYPREEDDAERYAALVEGNDVVFPQGVERGQRFRIRRVEEVREGKKIYKVVEAHHIAFTLGNYFLDDYIDFAASKTLEQMLTMLGNDTPFTFAIEGDFVVQDIFDWGEKKKFDLLQELRQLYGAELAFDNHTITLTTRKGGNHGARVRYAHNMKGIRRTSHDMERITRLYGYGKNGLTIEGHAGHTVKYIDSGYLDPNNPFMAKMEWPEIETQARLLQEMEKHLAKYELPNNSYTTDFIQMEKIDPDFQSERIREAGDTVTVLDNDLGYSFDARANEYDRYPFEPKRGSAVLSNFRQMKTSDYIFQATVASKKAMVYTSNNAVLKGVKYDDSLTLVDGLGMKVTDDFGRERIRLGQTGPGEYGMAMFNKSGIKTIWQDAATGDGRFQGKVIASSFEGGTIAIGSGNNIFKADANGIYLGHAVFGSAPFRVNMAGQATMTQANVTGTINATGGTITGNMTVTGSFTGGTITGALIRTAVAGRRIELSSTQSLLTAYLDDQNHVDLTTLYSGRPALTFTENGVLAGMVLSFSSELYLQSLTKLNLTANQGIYLIPGNGRAINIPSWSSLFSEADGYLSNALNSKATKNIQTGSAGPYNGGIPIGTVLMVQGGGTFTWQGIPTHAHTQN